MDTKRVPLLLRLVTICLTAGWFVSRYFWPFLQRELASLFPAWMLPVTLIIAFSGIFSSLGLMNMDVLPKYHSFRIGGYGLGCAAFLLNLLIQRNEGNVVLEVALVSLSVWSLAVNTAESKPISRDPIIWRYALVVLGLSATFGIVAAMLFSRFVPIYSGEYWWGIVAQGGACVLFVTLAGLETGVISDKGWQFPTFYGLGNAILLLSYLGQPTYAGEAINFAMCSSMFLPLILKVKRRKVKLNPVPL